MVFAKARQRRHRVRQHRFCRAGPDRADHGQQVGVAKQPPISALPQKMFHRLCTTAACSTGHGACGAVKSQDVAQHAPERRAQQVAFLRKQRAHAGASPFESGVGAVTQAHGEGHLRWRSLYVKKFEQRHQIRIGSVVEHQKAGINRVGQTVDGDIDGVGMSAQVVVGLQQHDLVTARQQPSRGKTGDTGADNGDTLAGFCGDIH